MDYGVALGAVFFGLVLRLGSAFFRSGSEPRPQSPRPPPADDPRWGPQKAEEQVVGKPCALCTVPFVLVAEARRCKKCSAWVHKKRCGAEHRMREHMKTQAPYR